MQSNYQNESDFHPKTVLGLYYYVVCHRPVSITKFSKFDHQKIFFLRVPFRGSFLYAALCNARQSGNFRTYTWFISHAFLGHYFCHCNVAHRLALICHDSRHHPELWDVYLILSNMINILKIVWLSLNLLGLPVIIIIKGKTNPGWSPKKRLDSYMPCRAMALTLKYVVHE